MLQQILRWFLTVSKTFTYFERERLQDNILYFNRLII